jgi:hypothetical protein
MAVPPRFLPCDHDANQYEALAVLVVEDARRAELSDETNERRSRSSAAG